MARHFFASGKGLLSTEEESLEVSAGDTGSEEALATVQAEGEAAEAEADAAVDEANVADGLEGVVALENMRLTLRAANENGGMDRFGAAMAKQHADFILQKFLKADTGLVMPSNESFGGAGSRVGSGVLTMEGIKDSAKRIWEAIVNFLKKMKAKVMDWVHKLFGSGEKLAKRAKAIIARADKAGAKKSDPVEIDNVTLFNKLAIDNKVEAAGLEKGMASLKGIAEKMVANSTTINKAIAKAIEDMGKLTKDSAAADVDSIKVEFNSSITNIDGGAKLNDPLPGNVKFRPAASAQGNDPAVPFGLPSNGMKPSTVGKLATLDLDAIRKLANIVDGIAGYYVASRDVGAASEKAYKELETFATKQTKSSDMEDAAKDAKDSHTAVISLFKSISGQIDGPIKAFGGHVMKTSVAALDYCDASLANFG